MSQSETINLSKVFGARRDRYATKQGDWILGENIAIMGDVASFWDWMRGLGGLQFRVMVRCLDGTVRDWIGRQGVYKSEQDGEVSGEGRPMANRARHNLAFWTATHGSKANTGTGKGNRTLKVSGIIAVRVNGHDYLPDIVVLELRAAGITN